MLFSSRGRFCHAAAIDVDQQPAFALASSVAHQLPVLFGPGREWEDRLGDELFERPCGYPESRGDATPEDCDGGTFESTW